MINLPFKRPPFITLTQGYQLLGSYYLVLAIAALLNLIIAPIAGTLLVSLATVLLTIYVAYVLLYDHNAPTDNPDLPWNEWPEKSRTALLLALFFTFWLAILFAFIFNLIIIQLAAVLGIFFLAYLILNRRTRRIGIITTILWLLIASWIQLNPTAPIPQVIAQTANGILLIIAARATQ